MAESTELALAAPEPALGQARGWRWLRWGVAVVLAATLVVVFLVPEPARAHEEGPTPVPMGTAADLDDHP